MKGPVTAPLLLGLLASCVRGPDAGTPGRGPAGRRGHGTESTSHLVPDGYKGRYQAVAFVLEDASHGPQMCGYVLESYPPQCAGPDLVGWSWAGVKHESAEQTRWGTYRITGRFDGTKFTVTEVADRGAPPRAARAPAERGDRTPCPEPPGGWQPIDPARATDAAMQAASALAQSSPDYGGSWIDQGRVTEATANDPGKFILNVSFTGDVAGHTTRLRAVWGGALCVSKVRYSEAQLVAIQREVMQMRSLRGSSLDIDVYTNRVTVEPWVAWERQQKELDARYGAGAVVLTGRLRPIDFR